MKKLIATVLAVRFLLANGALACSPEDIEITDWNWQTQSGWVIIVGELVNHCAEATGVQLHIVYRDANKQVVDVEEPWPASTNNIGPGKTYAFKTMDVANQRTTTASVSVLAVKRWHSAD